jgi:hypothetical protein
MFDCRFGNITVIPFVKPSSALRTALCLRQIAG